MFHPSVVFEKGNVIGGGFDTEHKSELVVHLDGGPTHVVSDAGSLDSGGKVVAEFVAEAACQLAPEKGRHLVGFHSMDGGSGNRVVDRSQVTLSSEHDVGTGGVRDKGLGAREEHPLCPCP